MSATPGFAGHEALRESKPPTQRGRARPCSIVSEPRIVVAPRSAPTTTPPARDPAASAPGLEDGVIDVHSESRFDRLQIGPVTVRGDDADVDTAVHAADERLLKKGRKSRRSRGTLRHVLQRLASTSDAPCDPCDGSGC